MKIKIPNIDDKESFIEDRQSIVLLGANGAGKTRMSVWIDENNPELNIHRISAQKSLNMPEYVSPTELKKAEDKFLYVVLCQDLAQNKMRSSATKLLTENRPSHRFFRSR